MNMIHRIPELTYMILHDSSDTLACAYHVQNEVQYIHVSFSPHSDSPGRNGVEEGPARRTSYS